MKRKAAVLVKYGPSINAFEIREIEMPKLKDDEILIELESSGVNFADVMARRGLYKPAPKPPCILGYDCCGYVINVGKEIVSVKKGDRVAALSVFGAYSSHVTVQEKNTVIIDENIPAHHACSMMTQGITAYYGAKHSVNVKEGERVLLHAAAGGVGSIMTQLLKNQGAIVIGTASKHKHDKLRQLGVDYPIDSRNDNFEQEVNELFPDGIDYVFDNIGGKSFKKAQSLLRNGGKIIAYGAASQNIGNKSGVLQSIKVALGFGFYSPIRYIQKSQSLIGLNLLSLGQSRPELIHQMANAVYDLYKNGEINLLSGKVFPYNQIADAHEFLESRQSTGKIAITWI